MTKKNSYSRNDRVSGGFIALPWCVLDSDAYLGLSYPARCLLIDIARQLGPDNNGKLLLTLKKLRKRGWTSSDVISRAKKELLAVGLLHQTVMGYRPNKASWYAVTWLTLYDSPKFDVGAYASFKKGAYDYARGTAKTSPLIGLDTRSCVPSYGLASTISAPSKGAMHQ